jgi:hypothetical protein
MVETITERRFHVSPKGSVKGKKETRALCNNIKITNQNETDLASEISSRDVSKSTKSQPRVIVQSVVRASGESKRKRHSGKALEESSQTSDIISPTKKMSRIDKPGMTHQESDGGYVHTGAHAGTDEVSEIE